MSKRLIEYDPMTRTSTWFEGYGTDGFKVCQTQDVEPYLERAKRLRNDPNYRAKGVKEDWFHFATIPNTVLHKILMDHHLDINNKHDLPRIEQVIKRDYKYLLTVDKV